MIVNQSGQRCHFGTGMLPSAPNLQDRARINPGRASFELNWSSTHFAKREPLMSLSELVDVIYSTSLENWKERNERALSALFGATTGRYRQAAKESVALRSPAFSPEAGVAYAAYIHPSNPNSGPYSGLSFVIFPSIEGRCLIGLVAGTQGLAPDEAILGRPGHARKARAICTWLNAQFGHGKQVAWAKHDPTRTDIALPDALHKEWPEHEAALKRYSREMYALFAPSGDRHATEQALTALLDLFFEERGQVPLSQYKQSSDDICKAWLDHLMPSLSSEALCTLLKTRRYVVLQGPPGTGKTKMATDLLAAAYAENGCSIQFHPNTTYESFVGGLGPVSEGEAVGLTFRPSSGALMQAAAAALRNPMRDYLLHIDEINRADLGKILGEAIFLLESGDKGERKIQLPYNFGEPFFQTLRLPPNLHILGTMNSADRSIAILDVAVRRRFAFVDLWPQMSVVSEHGCPLMQEAFTKLLSIFVEHATEGAFSLVPGHSYFLEQDTDRARQGLKVNLKPLLDEYLAQGYVTGFAEPIRSYLQWLDSL